MATQMAFILGLLVVQGVCGAHVPVYIWSRGRLPEPTPALAKTDQKSFKNWMSGVGDENTTLVVFLADALSPEGFAGGVFPKLRALREDHYVRYKPHVQEPVEVLKQTGKVLVELGQEDHDHEISAVYKSTVEEFGNVAAVYTALRPSRVPRNATEDLETGIVFAADHILFYLTAPGTCSFKSKSFTIDDEFLLTSKSNTTSMSAHLKGGDLQINFEFVQKYHHWYVKSMGLKDNNSEVFLTGLEYFYAPLGFSYHCAILNLTSKDGDAVLNLPGFQIQPFLEDKRFGEAYDCVGFVTIGICCGLLITGLLLTIFFGGLTMMWDLKTMARFDDPKKKGLTIVAEAD